MYKVAVIAGTRPEAIKMAPIVKELEQTDGFECHLVATAQHRDMLDQVLELFDIEPFFDLDIMRANQDLTHVTTGVLHGMQKYISFGKPDMILVQGDTTTTYSAALAAFYAKIPVGYVEAGLRTWDRFSPWPEEANRQMTTSLCDIHFPPTQLSCDNLLDEKISREDICITGNTAIDALNITIKNVADAPSHFDDGKTGILVTAHRRENHGQPIRDICEALLDIADALPDVQIVYPVHFNPNIQGPVRNLLGHRDDIKLIDPVDYTEFVKLMNDCTLILSDSGGVQEEAPSLNKPVLVMRESTERPEGVDSGAVKLVGTDKKLITETALELLKDESAYNAMAAASNPYGDGLASKRIVYRIGKFFEMDLKDPGEFTV